MLRDRRRRCSSRMTRALAGWALTLICGTAPASAQTVMSTSYMPETSGGTQTFVTRADLVVFVRVLKLGQAEQAALSDLFEAYRGEVEHGARELREFVAPLVEKAEALQDQRILEPVGRRVSAWNRDKEKLEKQFLADLTSLLTAEQEARWPLVERELRRLKQARNGWMSGEAVDVIRLLDQAAPGAGRAPGVEEVLEEYSRDLDAALVARQAFILEHVNGFTDLLKNDPAGARACFEQARSLRIKVRDVNARAIRRLAEVLPPGEAEELRRAFIRESLVRFRDPGRVERLIEAARRLDSLTREQRAAITALADGYVERRWKLLARVLEAEFQWEEKVIPEEILAPLEGREPIHGFRGGGDVPPEGSAAQRLRLELFEFDEAARIRVEKELTPEQRDRLPSTAGGPIRFYTNGQWGSL